MKATIEVSVCRELLQAYVSMLRQGMNLCEACQRDFDLGQEVATFGRKITVEIDEAKEDYNADRHL